MRPVASGWEPGPWLANVGLLLVAVAVIRYAAHRSQSAVVLWLLMALNLLTTTASGLTLRALYFAVGGSSFSLLFSLDFFEESLTMLLCRACSAATGAKPAAAAEGPGPDLQRHWGAVLGGLSSAASIFKGLSIAGLPLSDSASARLLSVPCSLAVRAAGLGVPCDRASPLRMALILAGSIFLVLASRVPPVQPGHAGEPQAAGASYQLCCGLALTSVVLSTVAGQLKEYLIHVRGATDLAVQRRTSQATALCSGLGLGLCVLRSGPPGWLACWREVLPIMALAALSKASDELAGIKLIAVSDYTCKKLVGMAKVLPALLFETTSFYIFKDTATGRPWGLHATLVLLSVGVLGCARLC